MRLDQYLQELDCCKDARLRPQLGISDNWPIPFCGSYDNVVAKLIKTQRFIVRDISTDAISLNYAPGTVIINIGKGMKDFMYAALKSEDDKVFHAHNQHLQSVYNNFMVLIDYQGEHPDYPGKRMQGIHRDRATAIAVCDITRILSKNRIPFCLLRTQGESQERDCSRIDCSRIVYHPHWAPKI